MEETRSARGHAGEALGGTALLASTAALVAVPSVSRAEGALATVVAAALSEIAHLEVVRIGDNVVARSAPGPAALLLAGHLDTVPPAGGIAATGALADGVLHGLGAVDMKGGLAVMLGLARQRFDAPVTYVFYAREEIARRESGLLELAAARPDLLAADAGVLLEPTGGRVEGGCQGVVRARVVLRGRRAHTARPWMGHNAVHRLAPLLARVATRPERRPVIDGCEFREALEAVAVEGGIATNVVPDEASVVLSHRFAPDRSGEEAAAALREYLSPALSADDGDEFILEEVAPAALPGLDHPLLARLVAATGGTPRAKLGWTDVAFFAERGIPAVNFGPGDPLLAHSADEVLSAEELTAVAQPLAALLATIS